MPCLESRESKNRLFEPNPLTLFTLSLCKKVFLASIKLKALHSSMKQKRNKNNDETTITTEKNDHNDTKDLNDIRD